MSADPHKIALLEKWLTDLEGDTLTARNGNKAEIIIRPAAHPVRLRSRASGSPVHHPGKSSLREITRMTQSDVM